jgi:hypothetical protein
MIKYQSLALLFSVFSILLTSQASASLSSGDYPDLYGSVLFDEAPAKGMNVVAQRGYGDSYGSVLLDPPPQRAMNVAVQPGYGDNYGSILLDLPSKSTTHIVMQYPSPNNNSNI